MTILSSLLPFEYFSLFILMKISFCNPVKCFLCESYLLLCLFPWFRNFFFLLRFLLDFLIFWIVFIIDILVIKNRIILRHKWHWSVFSISFLTKFFKHSTNIFCFPILNIFFRLIQILPFFLIKFHALPSCMSISIDFHFFKSFLIPCILFLFSSERFSSSLFEFIFAKSSWLEMWPFDLSEFFQSDFQFVILELYAMTKLFCVYLVMKIHQNNFSSF